MNLPILKYVDVLIGLAVVMVLVSTVVLAITQALLNLLYTRARHLRRGLTRMIRQMDPSFSVEQARQVAALLLRHPLIGQQTFLSPLRRLVAKTLFSRSKGAAFVLPALSPGTVVQRDELIYLLIEFAAGEGPLMDPLDTAETPEAVRAVQRRLANALRANGIEDPAATIRGIRSKIVENERTSPTAPAHLWRANAVVDCASSDFLGKIHQTFDNTIARVVDAFATESHLWVTAVALVVAVVLQLDSVTLLRRLSTDDSYRAGFVDVANALEKKSQMVPTQADAAARQLDELVSDARGSLEQLKAPSIDLVPKNGLNLPAVAWPTFNTLAAWPGSTLSAMVKWADPLRTPGIVLSWVLLSLGAPFWYDQLKNALRLRSLLARKDDDERQERTEQQKDVRPAAVPPAAVATAAADVSGEAGDLSATGALG